MSVNAPALKQKLVRAATVLVPVILWLVLWFVVVRATKVPASVLPPPEAVIKTMFSKDFIASYAISAVPSTVEWAFGAWLLGTVTGLVSVFVALKIELLKPAFSFPLLTGRCLPSVLAIPLFAAVMGLGRESVFACAVFLTICYSVPALEESIRSVAGTRSALREALGLNAIDTFILILAPGIGRAVRAIGVQSLGIGIVVTVAGEMILSLEGTLGRRVADLMWLLRMTEVYALVAWLVVGSILANAAAGAIPKLLTLPAIRRVRGFSSKVITR